MLCHTLNEETQKISDILHFTLYQGVIEEEDIGWKQIVSLIVILTRVYFSNKTGKVIAVAD